MNGDLTQILNVLNTLWNVFKNWWWVLVPFLLCRPFLFLWLWWRRELCAAKRRFVLLEIKMPREVLKPLRAMEQVFSSFWGDVYGPPDWWKKWIDGETLPSFSLEIVSIGGKPHFFIRILEVDRNAIESIIYSQYPDAEISVADDYAKKVPQDIPNTNWDLWGCDFQMLKEDVYPIKTYPQFFEERPEAAKEEKRLDPLSMLLEGMTKLGSGEQLWVQITATPITNAENNYVDRGKALVNKLVKRPEKPVLKPIIQEAIETVISGPSAEPEAPKEMLPPEMRLTAGEREVVSAIENKVSKYGFLSFMRFIYLGKRDVFFKPQVKLGFSFSSQFGTTNLNGLKPLKETSCLIPKSWFLPKNLILNRREYLRKRKIFRNYVSRLSPFFPRSGGTFILDTEELATLYHFPGIAVAPSPIISRVETKKREAPPGLPTE